MFNDYTVTTHGWPEVVNSLEVFEQDAHAAWQASARLQAGMGGVPALHHAELPRSGAGEG